MKQLAFRMHLLTMAASIFLLLPAAAQQIGLRISEQAAANSFPLVASGRLANLLTDSTDASVVQIAAKAFCNDIALLTGKQLPLQHQPTGKYTVIAGTIGHNKWIDALVASKRLNVTAIQGKWECFTITTLQHPFPGTARALIIAGSDARGTAFGIFELSKQLGVQPFYWWADVSPTRKKALYISEGSYTSSPPAVQYRGIFLNDEDWGLQPWAAKTFEPETGDIGPKTYAKIFELLLRLKANLIWPAMHEVTKPFFTIPGNVQMAEDYSIVIGTSHAEPMLRTNTREWHSNTMGPFNYVTNKPAVYQYWKERVQESKGLNAMYSMGMRGVHDSKMEGVKDAKEAVPLLQQIVQDQRQLLGTYIHKNVTSIPQVFTAYKEVLEIYDNGLQLPDDITIVWPDDNYGYIQRLSNAAEQQRNGGSGVYYHASYWGRPHDYLWLSSQHPALIREEMMKAYQQGATKLWILNVGDIKPLEYNIEMFLDMAYQTKPFTQSSYVQQHLQQWLASNLSHQYAAQMSRIMWHYYQLAFERKPEFMGWSQTEPTTKTSATAYNHFYYGDEAAKRIHMYEQLQKAVQQLQPNFSLHRADAFYQLMYYPVMGAALMNKKWLYQHKASLYQQQQRLSATHYAAKATAAYDSIALLTRHYNTTMSGGKWHHMMSMQPRNLPVFLPTPVLPEIAKPSQAWQLAIEAADSIHRNQLPAFDDIFQQQYFIDVYLCQPQTINWQATASADWIQLSHAKGTLNANTGHHEQRIVVNINWAKAPLQNSNAGSIRIAANGITQTIQLEARRLRKSLPKGFRGFVPNNGLLVMHAAGFTQHKKHEQQQWQPVQGLGYSGKGMQVLTSNNIDSIPPTAAARLSYTFYQTDNRPATLHVFTLPTHPVSNLHSVRYAIQIDDGPLQITDTKTVGRSEAWKQNVLANRTVRQWPLGQLSAGVHTLHIYAIDPGVILDEIRINWGGLPSAYSLLSQTKVAE
ncbi:MAG: glycosyl hydrolase 115 family protein [Chitinophagaceae bacterium]|nr:glycosyl hydrolase 115 family protein [Chitinophagaceae bacterium]